MPAFLTALEMAFTAVHIAFSSVVSSPVPLAFLPSSSTNLVKVTALVSKDPRSDMTADFKILADVKKIQNLAVNNTVSIIMSKSCNTFSRGDKTMNAEMLLKRVYGELNQWEVHCQRLRGVTDWLRGSFKTMMHCGWKPPRAWSVLCHHDHGSVPVKSYYFTSGSSLRWMEALFCKLI